MKGRACERPEMAAAWAIPFCRATELDISRRTHPNHDTAPVSLYKHHTITLRKASDHKNCGQKNDGHTGSRCLNKAVLAYRGGGDIFSVATKRQNTVQIQGPNGLPSLKKHTLHQWNFTREENNTQHRALALVEEHWTPSPPMRIQIPSGHSSSAL